MQHIRRKISTPIYQMILKQLRLKMSCRITSEIAMELIPGTGRSRITFTTSKTRAPLYLRRMERHLEAEKQKNINIQ